MDECFISTKDCKLPAVVTEESLPGDSPEPSQVPRTADAPSSTMSGLIVKTPTKLL